MVTAFETFVDLLPVARSEERKERTRKDKGEKIKALAALLNDCGEFMTTDVDIQHDDN
jgi:hypothetical protein